MEKRRRIEDPAVSRLLSSPIRLEILGQFSSAEALSVRELAERMGRPPGALHYHVRLLNEAGLLDAAGKRRRGKRHEALYRPSASRYEVAVDREQAESLEAARQAIHSALRMAQRDFDKALEDPRSETQGPRRNLLGTRIHARMKPADLEELNRRLAAIDEFLEQICGRPEIPEDADAFCSLTILMAPMLDRQT